MKGHTIITSDGSTLLGADNKAGVAEIMTSAGTIDAIQTSSCNDENSFTPDEEIGRGADHVDLKKLGAEFGYTMDGATKGSLEDETFSADGATIVFRGANTHPGYAHKKMANAIKAAEFSLPLFQDLNGRLNLQKARRGLFILMKSREGWKKFDNHDFAIF